MDPIRTLEKVNKEVTLCTACPRLVDWREKVSTEKRAAFIEEEYWGKGVPGFGDPKARILIVGLAPAAMGQIVQAEYLLVTDLEISCSQHYTGWV